MKISSENLVSNNWYGCEYDQDCDVNAVYQVHQAKRTLSTGFYDSTNNLDRLIGKQLLSFKEVTWFVKKL